MSSALMDDGSRAIQQQVEIHSHHHNISHIGSSNSGDHHLLLDEYYEIEKSVDLIIEHGFKRVSLQFPDYLLSDATAVSYRIQQLYSQKKQKQQQQQQQQQSFNHTTTTTTTDTTTTQVKQQQQQSHDVSDIEDVLVASSTTTSNTTPTIANHQNNENNDATNTNHNNSDDTTHNIHVYILGDTSYGSCCVDEVNAQHVHSDFIIHYGNACLNMVRRIPVLHVFGRDSRMNVESCYESLNQYIQQHDDNNNNDNSNDNSNTLQVIVMYDLLNEYSVNQVLKPLCMERMSELCSTRRLTFAELNQDAIIQNMPNNNNNNNNSTTNNNTDNDTNEMNNNRVVHGLRISDRYFKKSYDDDENNDKDKDDNHPPHSTNRHIFYITSDTSHMTSLLMELNQFTVHIYHTESNGNNHGSNSNSHLHSSLAVQRHLKRRYYLIQLAREAQVIGIVVATTSISNYLQVLAYLKQLVAQSDKKYYVFFVGKLNVPKMANFELIDLFCMIGCSHEAQSSALFDHSRDYLKPIVTPYELELALKYKEWKPDQYTIDFNTMLSSTSAAAANDDDDDNDNDDTSTIDDESGDQYEYSFISGTMKRRVHSSSTATSTTNIHQFNNTTDALQSGGQLMHYDESQRALMQAQMTPAMNHLAHREYRGLSMITETLDQETGEPEEFAKLEKGRSGIACDYTHEHDQE